DEPVEQPAESTPARLDLREKIEFRRIAKLFPQGRDEESLRMKRLGKVVAGGRQKAGLFLAQCLKRITLPAQLLGQDLVLMYGDGIPARNLDTRARRHEEGIGEKRARTRGAQWPGRGHENRRRIGQ